jgi:hypothetical protein
MIASTAAPSASAQIQTAYELNGDFARTNFSWDFGDTEQPTILFEYNHTDHPSDAPSVALTVQA